MWQLSHHNVACDTIINSQFTQQNKGTSEANKRNERYTAMRCDTTQDQWHSFTQSETKRNENETSTSGGTGRRTEIQLDCDDGRWMNELWSWGQIANDAMRQTGVTSVKSLGARAQPILARPIGHNDWSPCLTEVARGRATPCFTCVTLNEAGHIVMTVNHLNSTSSVTISLCMSDVRYQVMLYAPILSWGEY